MSWVLEERYGEKGERVYKKNLQTACEGIEEGIVEKEAFEKDLEW